MKKFLLLCLLALPVLAQTHQHGAMPAANNADGSFNPFIAADARGQFYLVYVQRTGGESNVMLRHSTDGTNFSAPVRVNDRAGDATVRNENPPKIAFGAKGAIYVCWASERGKYKGNVRFARSTDGGKTFAPALTLNSDGANEPAGHAFQSLAVNKQGHIYVAWIDERNKQKEDRGGEIWLAVSTDGGKTFGRDHRILTDVCECCRTNLQVDATGTLYLSYRTVPHAGPMYRDTVLARSHDGGNTFTTALASADQWEINGCPIAGPSFSLDPTGQLTVVWFMGGGERPGLYYATSANRGASFAPRQLLDSQQQLGKHTHTTGLPGGKVLVAWDDVTEKTFSYWGVLDPQKGLVRRSQPYDGVTYPVVATNGQIAVIAGIKSSTREIAIFTESLKLAPVIGMTAR